MSKTENNLRPTWDAYTYKELAVQIETYGWEVGNFSYGRPSVHEAGFGHLRIGRFCSIASGVDIVLANHQTSFISTYPFSALNSLWEHADPLVSDHRPGSVDIGNDVWIGINVCILPGTTIGDGCIIGAGSVVSGVIPPYSIVTGNPAIVKRKRFSESHIERLLSTRWWDLQDDEIDRLIPLLVSNNIEEFIDYITNIRSSRAFSDTPLLKGSLVPCVNIWGKKSIITDKPNIRIQDTSVYYIPQSNDKNWGIFNSDGTAVLGTLDYHGPNNELKRTIQIDCQCLGAANTYNHDLIYGGVINAHFGHFLVNTLPRLWPLAYEPLGNRKILVHATASINSWFTLPFIKDIFHRLGLEIDDFVQFDIPTIIENLEVSEPSFQEQTFAHVAFGDLCKKIGSTVDIPKSAKAKPIYLSKTRMRSGVGRFLNEEELVICMRRYGVEIVYPETLSFAEQVRMFSDKAVITGGSGSAFHTGVFSSASAKVIAINPMEEVNSNFLMLDDLSLHDCQYFFASASSVEFIKNDSFITSIKLANPQRTAAELMDKIRAVAKI